MKCELLVMSVSCGSCSGELCESVIDCRECTKSFHPGCVNLNTDDFNYLKEQQSTWKCSSCVKSVRRLRSGSGSKNMSSSQGSSGPAPKVVSSGQGCSVSAPPAAVSLDHINAILAELRGIKIMQQDIVKDISLIRESQSKLAQDINRRCNQLQEAVKECNTVLSSHTDTLNTHESRISDIFNKMLQVDNKISELSSLSSRDPATRPASTVDEVLDELNEIQRRKANLIIFKIPESSSDLPLQRKAHDEGVVTKLIADICGGVDFPGIKVGRVGTRFPDKTRPIRVTLQSEEDVRKVVANSKRVRNVPNFEDVIITYDRTPRQQSRYRDLRQQLQERINGGENNLRIRYDAGIPKIVKVN